MKIAYKAPLEPAPKKETRQQQVEALAARLMAKWDYLANKKLNKPQGTNRRLKDQL